MLRNIILLVLFLMTFQVVNSQTFVFRYLPLNQQIWGYLSLDSTVNIKPQFSNCYDFSEEGIALTYYIGWEWVNFLSINGNFIKPVVKDYYVKNIMGRALEGFNNGLIVIRNNEIYGCLNTNGVLIIPMVYDNISEFNSNHAIAKKEKIIMILKKNGIEIPLNSDSIKSCKHFSEGLSQFKGINGKYGYIDTTGRIVISSRFIGSGYFKCGFAWAKSFDDKIGFINIEGKWKIKPIYDIVEDFDNESGMALVCKDNKWMYIDTIGNTIEIKDNERYVSFKNGLARGYRNKKVGYVNKKGEWEILPIYEDANDFMNGFAAVKLNKKWGFINKKGEWVVEPNFSRVGNMSCIK